MQPIEQPFPLKETMDKTNTALFITLTGGGSGVFDLILSKGGASSFFVEGNIPYGKEAIDNFLEGPPNYKYGSGSTARELAMQTFLRGLNLTDKNVLAIGVSAILGFEGQREGRENKAWLCAMRSDISCQLVIDLKGTRQEQENQLAIAIYYFIDEAAKIERGDLGGITGYGTLITSNAPVHYRPEFTGSHLVLIPGSFNPFHAGHAHIKEVAEKFVINNDGVLFEMSNNPLFKRRLSGAEIHARLQTMGPFKDQVIVTPESFMQSKVSFVRDIYPSVKKVTLVVGDDTFTRMIKDKVTVEWLETDPNISLLVVPRLSERVEDVLPIKNKDYPYLHGATFLLRKNQELDGISSTKLRTTQ